MSDAAMIAVPLFALILAGGGWLWARVGAKAYDRRLAEAQAEARRKP